MGDLNDTFHDAYGRERDRAAGDSPLFVVVGDVLTLLRGGKREDFTFVPPRSHAIKAAAHAPVALYSLLRSHGEPARLAALKEKIEAALTDAPPEAREVLERTGELIASPPARNELDAAARRLGPLLLRLTEHATRLQLTLLHEHVTQVLGTFDAEERRTVTVVVTGDHQARIRSLPMQYFEKRFGKGEQVTYAEGATSVDDAVKLVGIQRFDRALAQAFFGDPKRLQRDVLGDAAAAQLETISDWE